MQGKLPKNLAKKSSKNMNNDKLIKYTNETKKKIFFCLKRRQKWSEMQDRLIVNGISDFEVPDNMISTSKYNVFTFLPKNLFEQFSKAANMYFLFIGVLQIIKAISNTEGQPLIYVPLFVIVGISMLKDIFEDLKRHKSDHEENFNKTHLFHNSEFEDNTSWKTLRIGDIIKILNTEKIPADILILKTSESKGACYIETKNLDGETNLKHKYAAKELLSEFENQIDYNKQFYINYEKPNPFLYTFNGSVKINEKKISLDHQNFLLRGCSLQNTKWVVGVVLYTGHDSKIMLNSVKSRTKRSQLEQKMNRQIIRVCILQLIFCIFCSAYYVIWFANQKNNLNYLDFQEKDPEKSTFMNFLVSFGIWLLLYTNFVPISLLVTLEMVKLVQGIFISKDENMKYKPTNTYVSVQSSNLNEELGQVEYIFSDKTGTLTCNIMEFKNISIGGVSYGDDKSFDISNLKKVTNVGFGDKHFFNEFYDKNHINYNNIKDCLLFLAICHTIITEEKENDIIYNASSPDELALVNFAKFCGVEFLGINSDNLILVKYENKTYEYKLLHILQFNSTRKRMSVIIQNSSNEIILYCKGADSLILERLDPNKNPFIDLTWRHLENYATKGLRTLVLAKKTIEINEYQIWEKKYIEAANTLTERSEQMMARQEEIEKNLILIGATAIEDKLQDEVGSTISILREANMKIWVLTGDKIETAINIGYACQLLNDQMIRIIIDGKDEPTVKNALNEGIIIVDQKKDPSKSKYALIISGDAMVHAMNKELSNKIMNIASKCQAVLACRVSPKQKQEFVSLVRTERPLAVTLAIGDGANDVNMISAAHIGIGIKGLEGVQAARASDYAIGEFKLLRRLLLYVGRESYRKNSYLIFYNFYKNMVLVLPHFWFGFLNGFSGQLLYDPWIFQFFNLFYASLPIMIYALFDEEYPGNNYLDVFKSPKNILENRPDLYEIGQKSKIFNNYNFWYWFVNGSFQGAIIIYFCLFSLENTFDETSNNFLDFTGMMAFSIVVILTNLKIWMFSNTFHPFSIFIVIGSIIFYFLNLLVSNYVKGLNSYGLLEKLKMNQYFFLISFLTVFLTLVLDMFIENYRKFFFQKKFLSKIDTFYSSNSDRKKNSIVEDLYKEKNSFAEHINDSPLKLLERNEKNEFKNTAIKIESSSCLFIESSVKLKVVPDFDALLMKNGKRFMELTDLSSLNNQYQEKHKGYAFSEDENLNLNMRKFS